MAYSAYRPQDYEGQGDWHLPNIVFLRGKAHLHSGVDQVVPVRLLGGQGQVLRDYMSSSIQTMPGPHGNRTRVLRMENRATAPDRSAINRNEYRFHMKAPPDAYREGYARYWMKLQGNLAELLPNHKPTPWYMIMEWKEPDSGRRKSKVAYRRMEPPSSPRFHVVSLLIQFPTFPVVSAARNPNSAGVRRVMPNTTLCPSENGSRISKFSNAMPPGTGCFDLQYT